MKYKGVDNTSLFLLYLTETYCFINLKFLYFGNMISWITYKNGTKKTINKVSYRTV